MFSKRPRRDKILVAITAFTVAAAIAVPLGLVFGKGSEVSTAVTNQPKSYASSAQEEFQYGSVVSPEPPPPAPLSEEFVFVERQRVVTDAPDLKLVGQPFVIESFKPTPDAGIKWDVRYVYAPKAGYSGEKYTYSLRRAIVPKPVTPLTGVALEDSSLAYGFKQLPTPDWQAYEAAWLAAQSEDTVGFLQQEGYQPPVFVKAEKKAAAITAPLEPLSEAEYSTVPAGYSVLATYEMRVDANHSGDASVITINYPVGRAAVTNAPADKNFPANQEVSDVTKRQQIVYGTAPNYFDPNQVPELKAALTAARYKDYVRRTPVLQSVPAGAKLPAGVTVGNPVTSPQAIAMLPPDSKVTVRWVAQHDDVNDPNYTGADASVYYVYTVIKGNFDLTGALSQQNPPAVKKNIDISETDLPKEADIFSTDNIQVLPQPYRTSAEPRVMSFYVLDATNQKTFITSMAELKNAYKNNKASDSTLYVTLAVPFDWNLWNFNGKTKEQNAALNANTDFVLESRLPIENANNI